MTKLSRWNAVFLCVPPTCPRHLTNYNKKSNTFRYRYLQNASITSRWLATSWRIRRLRKATKWRWCAASLRNCILISSGLNTIKWMAPTRMRTERLITAASTQFRFFHPHENIATPCGMLHPQHLSFSLSCLLFLPFPFRELSTVRFHLSIS